MLAGGELYIPHDARPDNGADGDGNESTITPTESEQECLYVKLHARAAVYVKLHARATTTAAAIKFMAQDVPAAVLPAAISATVPAAVPATIPAIQQYLQRMDPE